MHSFSQKCQSDQQRQEADEYQSVFEFFLFYLLECAHILCKYCCSVFLSYEFEVTSSAIVSLKMWWSVFVHQIGKGILKKNLMHNLLCWNNP